MGERPIPPHRILVDEDVHLEYGDTWQVACGDGMTQLVERGGIVTGWEPGRSVVVSNSLRLEGSAYARLGASRCDGMSLRLVATACTARDLDIVARHSCPLPIGSDDATPVELSLDGSRLAGDISISLSIVVESPALDGDQLSPSVPGARLWSSRWRARIEGGRARLAVEAIDFDQYFGSAKASNGLIHVVVADDPHLEIEQGLLVYLNSAAEGFIQEVARKEARATALLWDTVLRRVLVAGCDMDFSPTEQYPDGSVGRQWQQWSAIVFGRRQPAELLAMHRGDLSEFEVRIQSHINMKDRFREGGGK